MADVITRFKLETTQFDSKLRDAAKGLQEVTRVAQTGGKDFVNFSQKAVESARALGQTASGATNAKDKVKDLVGAFNDGAKAYNNLTQKQQQSDFGKELSKSLVQLQQRIKEAKEELYGLGDAVKGGGGGLFGEGGMMKGMLQVAGGNLITMAAGWVTGLAGDVKDAIVQSAELARQAEGVQIAFARLGRGDILDGLREATHNTVSDLELMKAAVKFNDFKLPVEELGTMLAFAQQKAKDTGQSIDYMVDSIVTGLGRKSLMILDNLGLSAAEIKEKMKETGDMTKAVGEIIREQMSKAGDYVETAADRAAKANVELNNAMLELGNTMQDVLGFSGWDELATKIKTEVVGAIQFTVETIGEAKDAWNSFMQTIGLKSATPKPASSQPGPNGAYWETTDAQGNVTASGRWLNGKQVQTGIGDVVVTGHTPEKKKTGPRSGGGSGKSLDISKIAFNPDKANVVKPADFIEQPSVWKQYGEGIRSAFEPIKDEMENLTEWTSDFNPFTENMKKMTEAAKQQSMAFNLAGQSASNFGAALQGIEDPAAKAAGTVVQAIASIALGFGTAAAQASSMGPWGWIAYVAAGLGTLATAISTVHSLTGYAEGGIVEGNSYSGDNLRGSDFGINAGELILNKAQQSTLASQLQDSGFQNMKLEGIITGETIHIVHNRYLKRSGQGEIVTW